MDSDFMPFIHNSEISVPYQTGFDIETRFSNWTYFRPEGNNQLECAYWANVGGTALRPHFHDELQLTLVLSGTRIFHVGGYELCAEAGKYVVIPPGCPHRTKTPISTFSTGVSLYLADACFFGKPYVAQIDGADWLRVKNDPHQQIAVLLKAAQCSIYIETHQTGVPPNGLTDVLHGTARVTEIAERQGQSREHFSRCFTRDFDISPHRYRIVDRLNLGRKRLREGESITDMVTDLGFADQSHFTRLFRATFGTTPGIYRKSCKGSQSF